MSSETIYIYTLTCPIENEVRYVGQSANAEKRLMGHLNKKDSNLAKAVWIRAISEMRVKPILSILDTCHNKKDAYASERTFISQYSQVSFLFNIVDKAEYFEPMKINTYNWLIKYTKTEADVIALKKAVLPLYMARDYYLSKLEERKDLVLDLFESDAPEETKVPEDFVFDLCADLYFGDEMAQYQNGAKDYGRDYYTMDALYSIQQNGFRDYHYESMKKEVALSIAEGVHLEQLARIEKAIDYLKEQSEKIKTLVENMESLKVKAQIIASLMSSQERKG